MNDNAVPETLDAVINRAREELAERIEDYGLLDDQYPEDELHEIADSAVPIYTSNIFEVAASAPGEMYLSDPGLIDPDATTDAEKIIQVAIYERVYEALWGVLQEAIEAREENDEIVLGEIANGP